MASTRRWLDRGNPRDAGVRHACQRIFTDNDKALAYAGGLTQESTMEYGVFVEHGWGNFSTHSDNAQRGDGSVDYTGGSVRLELGAKLLANEESPWSLDLNLTGYAGKKQGLQGGVSVKFMF